MQWTLKMINYTKLTVTCLVIATSAILISSDNNIRKYKQKYTIEDLLTKTFPKKTSNDLDMDPCKAGHFLDDIAIQSQVQPNKLTKDEVIFQEEVEKYKKEVLEGLQVEEEGLTNYLRKKSKQIPNENPVRASNDPLGDLTTPENGYHAKYDIYWKSGTHVPDGMNGRLKRKKRDNWSQKIFKNRKIRAATARKERIWDYGVIPYEIDGNFSGLHRALFKQAMKHWENFTCIKFIERDRDEHPNYITFTEKTCGCCSFVGKRGNGGQAISIGKNCDKFGIVVHELGHVVGFWHEHTRPDRDKHVEILRDNIMNGQEYNFNKLTDDEVNSLGLTYDYDSIMHYARSTFSKGTFLDTIQPIDVPGKKKPEIGQRVRLSQGDIAQTNILYKCPKCGETFQMNTGKFSPQENAAKCEWRITATHGEKILLNISDLNIAKSHDCRTEYVEVRDGYWHKSPILGVFCKGKFHQIMSRGSRMLVKYVSSYPKEKPGFKASFEAICGGDLVVETEGHLESPNFPDDYQPNKECIWRITVPEEFRVALKFQSFEVENHDGCVYDYIEIHDGLALKSPVLKVYCGYKIPQDVTSSSNQMLVKFVSDGSVQKAGFSALILKEYDECSVIDHGCEQECINTIGSYECSCKIGYELHSDGKKCEAACGGMLSDSNGTITSPSFPELYPLNKNCVWEIKAEPQFRITLNFTHFDLEGNNAQPHQCEYDRLEVYSKMSDNKIKDHGLFCGSKLPSLITSDSNILRIVFSSDSSTQKTGFAAIYFTGT
ncbi:unnamed protein product [Brassicogethes aeneus]|uniref:Metalloendopeptidase n=1 Tax=Brassicogethes aeneus TaxID=1431903 RepID=A0A9P0BAI6_BRAAE|nr:unnamed protein product [Brassicogethes aeneus]